MKRLFVVLAGMLLIVLGGPVFADTVPYLGDGDDTTSIVTIRSGWKVLIAEGTLGLSKTDQGSGLFNYTLGNASCEVQAPQMFPIDTTIQLWTRRYEMARDTEMGSFEQVVSSPWNSFSMMTGTNETLNWPISVSLDGLCELYSVIEVAIDDPSVSDLELGGNYGFLETDTL